MTILVRALLAAAGVAWRVGAAEKTVVRVGYFTEQQPWLAGAARARRPRRDDSDVRARISRHA